jgi:hypothetical protein
MADSTAINVRGGAGEQRYGGRWACVAQTGGVAVSDLFDVDELALVRSSRPIALTVSPAGDLGVVD